MPVSGGYMGRILIVNLSDRTVAEESLPDEAVLRKYVGGTGLGLYYLRQDLLAQVRQELVSEEIAYVPGEPADEIAPLIFMTGPLTGTGAPSSSDFTTVCINFEVPYAAGIGHSHGFWGPYLKFAGYDGIIVKGVSTTPVYISVDDGKAEIRDARQLWGQDTRETERLIKLEMGGEEDKISVACIGPGGEALLHGGMIKNDRNHGAGKGSPGAIMGSKKLKAIAVRGSQRVPIADSQAFSEAVVAWEKERDERQAQSAAKFGNGSKRGIVENYPALSERYFVAFKNLTDPEGGKSYATRFSEACSRWKITRKPSYNCAIECAYDVQIGDGPFAGFIASVNGGAESLEGAAAMIGVDEPGAVLALMDFYDSMGLESSTVGCVVAMAFEAYNTGLLTLEDTDGLELKWGDHEAAMELIRRMIAREGFGRKLAAGLAKASEAIGRAKGQLPLVKALQEMTVHVKGAGVSIHDWRQFWGMLLGQIVSPAGPGSHSPGADWSGPPPDSGYSEVTPGIATSADEAKGKAREVRFGQRSKMWSDCTGVCWFCKAPASVSSKAIAAAVGWQDFTPDEALEVGDRIAHLMRLIAVQRGFEKQDDFDISPRLLQAPAAGPAAGKSIAPYLSLMVDEYYRLMGWDVATGAPTDETLARLGLEA